MYSNIAKRLLALALGGLSPLLVVLSAGKIIPLRASFYYYLLPAYLILIILAIVWARQKDDTVGKQIGVAFAAGIALTLALDAIRYGALATGFFPMDSPTGFGMQITGWQMSGAVKAGAGGAMAFMTPPIWVLTSGYLYHYLNGIAFALIYFMFFGRQRYYWAILYALVFVEVGMMVSFPVLMPGATVAALNKGGGVLVGSFLAHLAMGYVLGFFSEHEVKGQGLVSEVLRWLNQRAFSKDTAV